MQANLNPEWDEWFEFHGHLKDYMFVGMKVFDEDKTSADDLLGELQVGSSCRWDRAAVGACMGIWPLRDPRSLRSTARDLQCGICLGIRGPDWLLRDPRSLRSTARDLQCGICSVGSTVWDDHSSCGGSDPDVVCFVRNLLLLV